MSLPKHSTQWVVKRFDGPLGLEMQVAPIPQLGLNDVMMKVHAISLNYHDVGTTRGTGGVSTFAILFAKAAGAKVIATTSLVEKAKKLHEMGADYVINYRDVENWGTQAQALTPGEEGVDVVVEIRGGATLRQSLVAVKMDGLISVVGVRADTHPEEQPVLMDMFFRFCTTRIAYVGPRMQFEEMNRAIEANDINPVIDGRAFSLKEARAIVADSCYDELRSS
ncbi:alcohol dehydrogenase [Fusarium phyllophilum]|uniref:Alcohol dehydrogenase n=1 Tax=Fusarium phyllophilum TaxID=47803 RepID=A0A8H5KAC5_9HYPO|nr:alcohol dehydrogenase [Fusarium phyllophilum]